MAVVVRPLRTIPETCSNCKFFNSLNSECRRYAPKAFLSESGKLITFYPKTQPTDSCGEFQISENVSVETILNGK